MMKGDKRFEYHRHPNLDEPYVSESQNYGLSLGSNPYVQFLGGDDFFYPHHLISMKDAIDAEVDENVSLPTKRTLSDIPLRESNLYEWINFNKKIS